MTGYEATRGIRAVELERRDAYEIHQDAFSRSPLYSPMLSSSALLSTSFPFNAPSFDCKSFSQNTIDLHLHTPELKLNRPALIIALTGFSSQQDQETAFESGVDIFMTKPVRFREVGRILEGWMTSRERERQARDGTGLGMVEPLNEKREVDEMTSGAKRSG